MRLQVLVFAENTSTEFVHGIERVPALVTLFCKTAISLGRLDYLGEKFMFIIY